MKSYDDITERVFRRGNEIIRKRQKRTALIKKTSFAVSGMCAAVLVCFGIWRDNDIKNSMNDFHNNSNIIVENATVPQTTTEYSQQTALSETITTSGNASAPPLSSTVTTQTTTPQTVTSEKKAFSENTVIFTTAPNPAYPTNPAMAQTETEKEYLHETTQIMLSTAFQTNPTETITDFLTQTTTTSVENNDEGGLYMKKLTSFFTSAVVLAASATPVIGHAEFNVDPSRYWSGEKAIFAAMDSGELETDIDGNGTVDALDGYLLECYTHNNYIYSTEGIPIDTTFHIPDEMNSRIEAIADYNGDGVVDDDDATIWVRHFIVNHGLSAEIFEDDYYVSEYISPDSEKYPSSVARFTSELANNMNALLAGYDLINDMCEKGIINLDANGNGQIDIGDAMDFYVYCNTGRAVMTAPVLEFVHVDNNYIPQEEWDYCDNVFDTYATLITNGSPPSFVYYAVNADPDRFVEYVMLYIVNNIEIKPEYFTEEYYAETFGERYYRSPYSIIISNWIKRSAGTLGLKPDEDAWLKFNTDDLNDFFVSYCNDVENGVRPAPDVNMDGVVDYNDYFASNTYFEDLICERTADDSILPADIWNNLAENCDFNGNGTSKDIYDILTVQLYVVKYADKIDDFDKAYEEYTESLGGVSPASVEGFSYENNVEILASLEKSNVLYGDANEDGDVDIADATAIVQSIGNPDKYALSKQGEINADCYNTGDGVTGMDALAIQKLSANMIDSLPFNE